MFGDLLMIFVWVIPGILFFFWKFPVIFPRELEWEFQAFFSSRFLDLLDVKNFRSGSHDTHPRMKRLKGS